MSEIKNIHTLSRVNLYEQVADRLEQLILAENEPQYQEGVKLPPEQELADEFGVSRNVVREAIKLLKERGLVEPRNGVGVYITKPDVNMMSNQLYRYVLMNGVELEQLNETRLILESGCAYSAAHRITEEQLSKMRDILYKMEDLTISVNERRELDFAFHFAIAEATGNALNLLLMNAMREISLTLIEKGIMIEGGIEDALFRHRHILAALERHDPEAAMSAMVEHLKSSLEQVEAYVSRNTADSAEHPKVE